jgi:hypothetical protein
VTVRARSSIRGASKADGNRHVYRLDVIPQAIAHPDHGEIVVEVPAGWSASGPTRFSGDLNRPLTLEVVLTRTKRAALLDEIILDPTRAVGRFLSRLF